MKANVLTVWLQDGRIVAPLASERRGPVEELAAKIRAARTVQVGNKVLPVVAAQVMSFSGRPRITCRADAVRDAVAKADEKEVE